jgi:competence protein ComEC
VTPPLSVPARWCLAASGAVAVGVLLPALAVLVIAALVWWVGARAGRGRVSVVFASLLVLGSVAAAAAQARSSPSFGGAAPIGSHDVTVRLTGDPRPRSGNAAVGDPIALDGAPWRGPRVLIGPLPPSVVADDVVVVEGVFADGRRRLGREVVAGALRVRSVLDREPSHHPLFVIGNRLRARVHGVFGGDRPADALVQGFLIGDTDRLPSHHIEDLRRSGLSHFVAVSGSNVALFLGVWWFVGFPMAGRPWLRSLFGFAGLAVFLVVTRWEPSVVRASVMAAVPLTGGLMGIPVDPWMALGTAVAVLLLLSADLITSVGFLLSVFATAGVLVGVAVTKDRRPSWLWLPLGATMGAQVAVAPILLTVFGSIPLVAPIANLLAAPLVAVSSVAGMAAIAVPTVPFTVVARWAAAIVLGIADVTAGGPQLGWMAALAVAAIGVALSLRVTRPLGVAIACCAALALATQSTPWPTTPTAVVLDIGQGDAILLQDPSGRAALIDGGRDPHGLDRALRRHGVEALALVVVTHADADHAGGLADIVDTLDVGEVWMGAYAGGAPLLDEIEFDAKTAGIEVRRVSRGLRATIGSFTLSVLGPRRRYLSDNDGSVVLLAEAESSILLAGDIEAVAQRELPPLRPDVLLVPHHGSATTDPGWLAATVGDLAILSYGPNTYGHPHPAIVSLLEESGAEIHQTATEGDVSVDLG